MDHLQVWRMELPTRCVRKNLMKKPPQEVCKTLRDALGFAPAWNAPRMQAGLGARQVQGRCP